jgi:muramidase (phage lysozyme)
MAALHVELGDNQAAIERLQQAQASAQTIEDNELKAEIDDLLATLTHA